MMMIDMMFMYIQAFTICFMSRYQLDSAIAFGGVATGIINAQLAHMVSGIAIIIGS